MAAVGDDMRMPRGVWSDEERTSIPTAMAPVAAGAVATDWPGYDHITAIGSFEDAGWPTVKPPPAPEPTKTVTAVRHKPSKSSGRCRAGEIASRSGRCKKLPVGHQLSLSHDLPPSALKAQYSF